MAVKDFIISFYASTPMLKSALLKLERPFVMLEPQVQNRKYKDYVVGNGNSVMGLWNLARSAGDQIGRVAVFGFSEGCQGVRAVLESQDASAIDAVVPCDGIHTDHVGSGLEMSRLGAYIAFAKLAAASPPSVNPNTKLLAITHSSIGRASLGPVTASTTETAALIGQEATKDLSHYETSDCAFCPAATQESEMLSVAWPNPSMPVGTKVGSGTITEAGWTTVRPSAPETGFMPPASFTWSGLADGWTDRRFINNLHIFGWSYPTKNGTKDPTGNRDHIFQAQMVLPYVAAILLVSRWNSTCSVSGFGAGPDACVPGSGVGFQDQAAAPLPNPYAVGTESPPVIVPRPVPVPSLPLPIPPSDGQAKSEDWSRWLALAMGLGAGYASYRFLRPRKTNRIRS